MKHLTGLFPFWSEEITDKEHTTATLSVNKPENAGVAMTFNRPWEGDCTNYYTIVKDDGFYRMYYQAWDLASYNAKPYSIKLCYAESKDGLHWERPNLGIIEFDGSKDNNIIKMILDNFTVMKDENPNCPASQKYKALSSWFDGVNPPKLNLYVSADGIHFEELRTISKGLSYDSQNNLIWDRHTKKYYCLMRSFHTANESANENFNEKTIREIDVMESEDLINWSKPVRISFDEDVEDYPLYTNCVQSYPYDDRYYVSFPTRYTERKSWSQNYERLCGKEKRKLKMEKFEAREGLALTDGIFMSSRDLYSWHRFDDAILTAGYEHEFNWVYGDCYPALHGLIETPGRYEGYPEELTLLVGKKHHGSDIGSQLLRFIFRRDGFASYKAGYSEKILRTVPFTFEGDVLKINFKTSARGHIYVNILDETGNQIDGYSSCELFGDTVERIVDFDKSLSELCGKAICLKFKMSDAEIFSVTFGE